LSVQTIPGLGSGSHWYNIGLDR